MESITDRVETPAVAEHRPRRISVVCSSCCGKTTLSKRLAEILQVPHIELDSIYHGPNWTETPSDVLKETLRARLRAAADGWVVDGNYYSKIGTLVLVQADIVVFLDLPLPAALGRAVRRSLRRLVSREVLWNGNREELRFIFTKDWIPIWVIRTHARKRRETQRLLEEHPHGQVTHLQSSAAVAAWLEVVGTQVRQAP